MDLGKIAGAAAGMAGDFDLGAKMEELGVDPSMLEGLSLDSAKEMLAEKGLDISALEGLGLDDMLAKFTGSA